MNLGNFCRALPKLVCNLKLIQHKTYRLMLKRYLFFCAQQELHAHLNGSLSVDTLKKLYKMQNPNSEDSDKIFTSIKDFSSLGEYECVFNFKLYIVLLY